MLSDRSLSHSLARATARYGSSALSGRLADADDTAVCPPLPVLPRAPWGLADPLVLALDPGVYAFPSPWPGCVGRLVVRATPDGSTTVVSCAVIAREDADATTDVAFHTWRRCRERIAGVVTPLVPDARPALSIG